MKDKLSVLIPDGDDGNIPLTVLRCLGQVSEVRVNILSREQWAPIRFSKHRHDFFTHNIDTFDKRRVDAILQAARQAKADIILPVEEATIRLIAQYSDEVKSIAALPPIPTPELMDIIPNKWLLADLLKKENIPHPPTLLYQSDKSHEQHLASLKFPVLVKPLEGFGGVGIRYFNELSELTHYLENEGHPERFIIQSFIHGHDIDCSVLCQNGEILAYTIQKALIPGKKRFEPAASIEFLYHERVYEVIQRLMRILNWSGVAHIDMRYDESDHEPKIVEINPRYWGSLVGSLVAGINFPYLACLTSMKINFPKPEYHFIRYSRVGVSFLPPNPVGLFANKNFKRENTIHMPSTTGLPFLLSDPLPELQKEFIKISKKMFPKPRKK